MYNEQQIQAYLNRLHYNKEITLTREVLDLIHIYNLHMNLICIRLLKLHLDLVHSIFRICKSTSEFL